MTCRERAEAAACHDLADARPSKQWAAPRGLEHVRKNLYILEWLDAAPGNAREGACWNSADGDVNLVRAMATTHVANTLALLMRTPVPLNTFGNKVALASRVHDRARMPELVEAGELLRLIHAREVWIAVFFNELCLRFEQR